MAQGPGGPPNIWASSRLPSPHVFPSPGWQVVKLSGSHLVETRVALGLNPGFESSEIIGKSLSFFKPHFSLMKRGANFLFLSFWLHWVFLVVCGLLIAVASLVAEHGP